MEMVTLESLVPSDHLLRQIDAFIDFEFVRDNGRPASSFCGHHDLPGDLRCLRLAVLCLILAPLGLQRVQIIEGRTIRYRAHIRPNRGAWPSYVPLTA